MNTINLDSLAWNNQLKKVANLLEYTEFSQEVLDFALYKACHQGHLKVVEVLMEYGAKINEEHVLNGFIAACANNHASIVMYLLNKKAVNVDCKNNQALIEACKEGNAELVDLLLDFGADACQNQALLNACAYNHPAVVDVLMYEGADPKVNNYFAFKYACQKGFVGVVEALLEHGVDANVANTSLYSPRINQLLKTYGAGDNSSIESNFKNPKVVDFKFEKFICMVMSNQVHKQNKIKI